ncbi:MAG: hypothetical protein QM736_23655 [Vicinamibacterales bacterium]
MTPRLPRVVCDLTAAALIAVALSVALGTVSGLTWPYDGDHFRDIAQAQATLNGHPLSDPFYAGEWVWYNPLLAWLLALVSLATGATVPLVHVQGGPWLNLLGPIAFYMLCARIAGRPAALVSVVLLLFVNCRTDPALTCATYSPWLFVATFTQGLFFLGVIAIDAAASHESDLAAAGVGVLAGLTFLSHTAPALLLAAIAAAMFTPRRLAIAGVLAAVVASPFLVSIVAHYHLHVVNDAPVAWAWPPTTRAGIGATLLRNAPLLIGGAAGAFVVRARIVYAWAGAAVMLTLYGLLREGTALPAFVPTFHFWRYTMAAATLFAGGAVAWAIERIAARHALLLTPALAALLTVWLLPTVPRTIRPRVRTRGCRGAQPGSQRHGDVPSQVAPGHGDRGGVERVEPRGGGTVGTSRRRCERELVEPLRSEWTSRSGARCHAGRRAGASRRRVSGSGGSPRCHARRRARRRRVREHGGCRPAATVSLRRRMRVRALPLTRASG